MPEERSLSASAHVRALAEFLADGDAVRVRVQRGDDDIEIAAATATQREALRSGDRIAADSPARASTRSRRTSSESFTLGRPAPVEGDVFDADRELGYIEALAFALRSTAWARDGSSRWQTVDGAAVEYGQPLFLVARGK